MSQSDAPNGHQLLSSTLEPDSPPFEPSADGRSEDELDSNEWTEPDHADGNAVEPEVLFVSPADSTSPGEEIDDRCSIGSKSSIEKFDGDESSLAVVPPDEFQAESKDEVDSSADQSSPDEERESQVPREDLNGRVNPTVEAEDESRSESDNDESYSVARTKFLPGEETSSQLVDDERGATLRRSFDVQQKISFDNFDSTQVDDLLGNKSLLKKIVRSGDADSRPARNSLATVSYELFLVDKTNDEVKFIEKVSHERFFVSEYDILPAIDISVQLMDRGERSLIDSDVRHCYGNLGCPEKNLPPIDSNDQSYRMKIDLVLEDWKLADDISSLSVEQRIFWGDRKKNLGNVAYRRREYSVALQCYRFALRFLDTNENPAGPDELDHHLLVDRFIQVENNRAQTYLITEQYDLCLSSVDNVLKHQPNNVKALFRRSRALFELGHYDQTVKHLKALLELPSEDVERDKITEMLNICQSKLAKYHRNEKEIYQRMFQSSANDSKAPKSTNETRVRREKANKTNSSWLPYLVLGGTALAALGFALLAKYR